MEYFKCAPQKGGAFLNGFSITRFQLHLLKVYIIYIMRQTYKCLRYNLFIKQ